MTAPARPRPGDRTVSRGARDERRPPVEDILTLAGRAPSVHNTQPWLWRVRGTTVDLFGDPNRRLPVQDPEGRNLVISCGAALHHLQVAAASQGWLPRVRRVPDPENPWHLATVRLAPGPTADLGTVDAQTIWQRRTDRRRFTSWPVPEGRVNRLAAEGTLWGAQVFPVNSLAVRRDLLRLAYEADRLQSLDEAARLETAQWRDGSADGVPSDHVPTAASAMEPADRLSRRFEGGTLADPRREPDTTVGGLLLICSWSDDTLAWLRCGESLSAVWLRATQDGMALLPLSQVFEVERTRAAVHEDVLGRLAVPQLLVRVGWPALGAPPLPPSPRRPVSDLLVDADAPGASVD
jgi:hypothetical protein